MSKQRFSLRKYKFGVASVLLGSVLVFGAGQVSAEETQASQVSLVATTESTPTATNPSKTAGDSGSCRSRGESRSKSHRS